MKEITKTVLNASGIHARPAGIFINEAKKFQSKITVTNLTTEKSADAKSILRVMTLCLTKGTPIKMVIKQRGDDPEINVRGKKDKKEKDTDEGDEE